MEKNKGRAAPVQPEDDADKTGGLAGDYKEIKMKLAEWMGRKAARLSLPTQKFLLVLVCAVGTCYFLHVTTVGFKKGTMVTDPGFGKVKTPAHVLVPEESFPRTAAQVMTEEFRRFRSFHLYMDSLARTASGRTLRDSINKARPGLLDTVIELENYYSQFNQ
ncbi:MULTISPECIES: hypothetical protein [Chitinophagaceae]